MAERTLIFAGGGTGGHLFPSIAIAERARAIEPGVRTLYICSDKPLDRRLLEENGQRLLAIPARALSPRPIPLMRLMLGWGACVRASRRAIRQERRRGASISVIAMGGYVAAPVVQAARAERAPITLVNLDASPGVANRWIARHASSLFTAATLHKGDSGKWTAIRPIVRQGAVADEPPEACRAALGLDPAKPTLLVTGASQGAMTINKAMAALAGIDPALFGGWQVFHQAGGDERGGSGEELRDAYQQAGVDAAVVGFCSQMGKAWGAADVAISRCGAGSVAEVWAGAVPTLFLPYPFHRDEHQRRNAEPLVQAGGALLVKDQVDAQRTARAMRSPLKSMLSDPIRREAMRESLRSLGPADGADTVARSLLENV